MTRPPARHGSRHRPTTDAAPSIRRVTAEDLNDSDRLKELYREAVRTGMWPNSANAALDFAALAEKALADDKHGTPGALFVALLKAADVSRVTQAHETRALQRWSSDTRHDLVDAANRDPATTKLNVTTGDVDDALYVPNVGYMHAVLMQCFMPQKRITERAFSVSHGRASLRIEAGGLPEPTDPGIWFECDVPSGPKARLILPYIIGEAVRTGSPDVDLGESLRKFMGRLDVPVTGGNAKGLIWQIQNIAGSTIVLGEWADDIVRARAARVADEYTFWTERAPDQRSFWTPTMTLSDKFFQAIQDHRVPVDMNHLVRLGRSPRRMDLYAWLSYRLPRIRRGERVPISLEALRSIFAPDITRLRNFTQRLHGDLAAIAAVYPEFNLEIEGGILWLKRSPPPVDYDRVIHRIAP